MKDFIIDHRTRCRHCGEFAKYWATCAGIAYNTFDLFGTHNRFKNAIESYYDRDSNEYYKPLRRLIRKNSIQGATAINTWFYKKNKHEDGTYRVVITCKCGKMTWLYNGYPTNFAVINGKLAHNYSKYQKKKGSIPGWNVR